MTHKIIEDGEKFKIKKLDEEGNSLGLLEESFDSHEAASAFLIVLEKNENPGAELETPKENADSSDAPVSDQPDGGTEVPQGDVNPSVPEETQPVGDPQAAPEVAA